MSLALRILIFLALNFGALAIGGIFTGKGVPSEWYANLNKAPWTPPGWMFGAAWTTIMVCYALYMAYLWPVAENKTLLLALFALQWVLNVSWNPAFFYFHQVFLALMIIVGLTIVVGKFLFDYQPVLKVKSLLILPYFVWLLIATSLNAYSWVKN